MSMSAALRPYLPPLLPQQRSTRASLHPSKPGSHQGGWSADRHAVSTPVRKARSRRKLVPAAEATSNNSQFEDLAEEARQRASRAAELLKAKASEIAEETKRKATQFERDNNLTGKAKEALSAASIKLEEVGDDLRRAAEKFDRDYNVSGKAQQAVKGTKEAAEDVDARYGIRRRVGSAVTDFRVKFPSRKARFDAWLKTPVGQVARAAFLVYLCLSGWAFQLFSWSVALSFFILPLLPLLAPLLLRSMKGSVVQGQCPACQRPFVGPRNQVLICAACRGVVWQPRQDYSKAKDPANTIIDVEIE